MDWHRIKDNGGHSFVPIAARCLVLGIDDDDDDNDDDDDDVDDDDDDDDDDNDDDEIRPRSRLSITLVDWPMTVGSKST